LRHNAAERNMIAGRRRHFHGRARKIPSKPLLREHQRQVLLLRANDLVFRTRNLGRRFANDELEPRGKRFCVALCGRRQSVETRLNRFTQSTRAEQNETVGASCRSTVGTHVSAS
jgi:hypothetical protein